ncbi:hypothetical protein [Tessaracoccus massiliensis]|uniref:hypothetical protein n=1 Tax=Tessaracoccus massiliensis TaxID=1522311 RepID=UPI00058F3BC2|nr:hypothetical protein [Tessaracoccus massiliensis]
MDEDHFGLDVTIADTDGGIVTRWVAVAEVIDTDGGESLRIKTSPGLSQWDQLGMHTFAAGHVGRGCDCG